MPRDAVVALLEKNRGKRGIAHRERRAATV